MAIVNSETPSIPQTLSDKQSAKVAKIKARNTMLLDQIVLVVKKNLADVWSDTDQENFSPQQVFNLFGSDAALLVSNAAALIALANAQRPNALPANAPKTLTPNQDGTVTVGV